MSDHVCELNDRLSNQSEELESLKKTKVLHICFHKYYGTLALNGFSL